MYYYLFSCKKIIKKFAGKEIWETDELEFSAGATGRRGWVPEKGGWLTA